MPGLPGRRRRRPSVLSCRWPALQSLARTAVVAYRFTTPPMPSRRIARLRGLPDIALPRREVSPDTRHPLMSFGPASEYDPDPAPKTVCFYALPACAGEPTTKVASVICTPSSVGATSQPRRPPAEAECLLLQQTRPRSDRLLLYPDNRLPKEAGTSSWPAGSRRRTDDRALFGVADPARHLVRRSHGPKVVVCEAPSRRAGGTSPRIPERTVGLERFRTEGPNPRRTPKGEDEGPLVSNGSTAARLPVTDRGRDGPSIETHHRSGRSRRGSSGSGTLRAAGRSRTP